MSASGPEIRTAERATSFRWTDVELRACGRDRRQAAALPGRLPECGAATPVPREPA